MCLADTKCFLPIRAILSRLSACRIFPWFQRNWRKKLGAQTRVYEKHNLHNVIPVAQLIFIQPEWIVALLDISPNQLRDGDGEVEDELVLFFVLFFFYFVKSIKFADKEAASVFQTTTVWLFTYQSKRGKYIFLYTHIQIIQKDIGHFKTKLHWELPDLDASTLNNTLYFGVLSKYEIKTNKDEDVTTPMIYNLIVQSWGKHIKYFL